jgi:hypothetical protein
MTSPGPPVKTRDPKDWLNFIIAGGTIALVLLTYLGVATAAHWFPFGSAGGPSSAPPSSTIVNPTTPTQTVALSPTVYLADKPVTSGDTPMLGLALISGQAFPHSIYFNTINGFATVTTTYTLNGQYRYFQAALGVQDDPRYTIEFEVFVDSQRVVDEVLNAGRSWPTRVDLRGKQSLTIEETATSTIVDVGASSCVAICGNAQLVGR